MLLLLVGRRGGFGVGGSVGVTVEVGAGVAVVVVVGVTVGVSVGGSTIGAGRSRGAATILVIPRQYSALMPRNATTSSVLSVVGCSQKSLYQSMIFCIDNRRPSGRSLT